MENYHLKLIKSFPTVDPLILKGYKQADEWVVLNEEDPDLHPIWIRLPEPSPLNQIDGFGLPAKEQKYKRPQMPNKLHRLLKTHESIDDIWKSLEENQVEYENEIKWIQDQWERLFNGYWFFNNGKPTWLCGWHYSYVAWWKFKDRKHAEYRDKDRRHLIGVLYAYKCTTTPVYNEDKKIVYADVERRIPKVKDTGFRTFLGTIYPKGRRDGATNKMLCAEYFETIKKFGVYSGIQSMEGTSAEGHFQEILVPGWRELPFFFKPKYSGFAIPKAELLFEGDKKRGNVTTTQDVLGSKIDFSDTAQSTYYDGEKIYWLLVDESGKTIQVDVARRHQVLKNCVAQGNGANIEGFMSYPSTIGEMKGEGGANFFNLCESSHWNKRTASGQTTSGLMLIYFPSYDGLEFFIDEYGYSVIDTPTPEQAKFIGRDIGAKEYLFSNRASYLEKGDISGFAQEVRLFPFYYREAFRTEDGDAGFNMQILNDRMDELKFPHNDKRVRGNFRWENDIRDSNVIWEPCENGRWYMSIHLSPNQTNRRFISDGKWFPIDPKFTSSADPYKHNTKNIQGKRMSDGGGAVFLDHDTNIDPPEKDIKDWKTNRIVLTYLNRPAKTADYDEDMLMQTVYFGATFYPETNVERTYKYFLERHYDGYLQYDLDPLTGKPKAMPGFNSQEKSKQELFATTRDYIQDHGMRDEHIDFLHECKEIKGMEDMTNRDLFTAGSGAIRGSKNKLAKEYINGLNESIDISDYVDIHEYY